MRFMWPEAWVQVEGSQAHPKEAHGIMELSLGEDFIMPRLSAAESGPNLYKLIDDTTASHGSVIVTAKRTNAILFAEND